MPSTADSILDNLALPFAPRKQAAILWYLATDRGFFEHARTRIKPQWFTDQVLAKVYAALIAFSDQFKRMPSKQELQESRGFMLEEPAVRSAMWASLEMAYNESQVYGLDVLKTELTEWLHAFIYKEGMDKANFLFTQQKFSDAYKIAAERIKLIQEVRFEEDFKFSFDNLAEGLAQSEARIVDGVTFGLKMLDDALTPGGSSTSGGLFRKDTTCLMAPVNIGKTTSNISTVAANIASNRRVLWLVHEGDGADLRDKLLCCLLDIDKPTLWGQRLTPQGRQTLALMEQLLKQNLTFIPYIRAQMTVEEVIPIIRRECEQAASEGRPYDLIVDDYPELLLSEYAKSSRMEERARIQMVYLIFTQLANELNVHCLVNIQTNRDGSRANRAEDRLLGMEDVAESWGAMAKVTNVITVNRSPIDMKKNRVTYHIVKSRSGATGKAIVANTNFDHAIAHSNAYGSAWYWAGRKMFTSEEMDGYLAKCQGGEISEARLKEIDEGAAKALEAK